MITSSIHIKARIIEVIPFYWLFSKNESSGSLNSQNATHSVKSKYTLSESDKTKGKVTKSYHKAKREMSEWTETEIKCLRAVYTAFDTTSNGYISIKELKEGLVVAGNTVKSQSYYRDIKYILSMLERHSVNGRVSRIKFQSAVELVAVKKCFPNILPVLETLKTFSLECYRSSQVRHLSATSQHHHTDSNRFRGYQTLFKLHSSMHDFDTISTEHSMTLHRTDDSKKTVIPYDRKSYKKSQHMVIIGISSSTSSSSTSDNMNIMSLNTADDNTWMIEDPVTTESFCWDVLDRIGIVDKNVGICRGDHIYDYNVNDLAYEVVILNVNKSSLLTQLSRLLTTAGCDIQIVHHESTMIDILLKKAIDFVIMDSDALIFAGLESIRIAHENEILSLAKRNHISTCIKEPISPSTHHSSKQKQTMTHSSNKSARDVAYTSHMDPPTYIPKLLVPIKHTIEIQRTAAIESGMRGYVPVSVRRLSQLPQTSSVS